MNFFITGNEGLIGKELEKRLTEEGNTVYGIDIKNKQDLNSLNNLKVDSPIDILIHTAAAVKINKIVENPEIANETNANGTFNALEFCRKNKIPKIVFMSSSRVLSSEKNAYTASKIYGEELCKAYSQSYGLEHIIIRPSTVYGPFWDTSKRLMHLFITAALAGRELKIFGDPKTKTLDFTYLDDFIDGTILTMNNPQWNKEYNISGEEEYNVYDLAKKIIKLTESHSPINVYPAEIVQPQKVKLDVSEIKRIGYVPKISLEEGVRRTVEFYKKQMKENSGLMDILFNR
jgi:nucleoside-diphosphate-sugar epimerase